MIMFVLLGIKIEFDPFVIDDSVSSADLIAILSILVTILIGWQIWNVIDFKNRVKSEIQESETKIENKFKSAIEKKEAGIKSYIEERFMKESLKDTFKGMYRSAMRFFNDKDYDTAFRIFCDTAVRSYAANEKETMNDALYMAELVINVSGENFSPNKRAFNFYKSIEETLKKIDTERANAILKFAQDKYGNLQK